MYPDKTFQARMIAIVTLLAAASAALPANPGAADPWMPAGSLPPPSFTEGSIVVPASFSAPTPAWQPGIPKPPKGSALELPKLPAPQPAPGAPATPELLPELPLPRVLNNDVQQQADLLKSQREALKAERVSTGIPTESTPVSESRLIPQLRRRATELMLKAAAQKKSFTSAPPRIDKPPREQDSPVEPPKDPVQPPVVQPKRSDAPLPKKGSSADVGGQPKTEVPPSTPKVVDPMALGEALFRNGEFAGALTAFRTLDLTEFKPPQRLMVQYLTACCLNKLGKTDEAVALYREVANSKGDPEVVECAQWQLGAIRWRHDIESEIEQLRKERKALSAKP